MKTIQRLLLAACAFQTGAYTALIANSIQAGEWLEVAGRGILGVWITWIGINFARVLNHESRR